MKEKSNDISNDIMKKVRSMVDSDGHRQIVQIIKAPKSDPQSIVDPSS